MKKYWNICAAAWTLALMLVLALLPACFESTQRLSPDGNALLLGLPFPFYTVLLTSTGQFAIHLNPLSMLADAFILYFGILLGLKVFSGVKR